ncbi:MAG TPA: 30S ribosomal protein S9 [Candidatus Thermoplasmatota archaeon]|nr:30S ribosomal protein S9 [Candidatus Thermoplasmatota archaeon]
MAKEQGPIVVAGKRKMAVARAVVSRGNGIVRVNRRPLEIWMPELARLKIQEPLVIAGERAQGVDIDVQIRGGGVMGQADAARTAIARGLVRFFRDDELARAYKRVDRSIIASDSRQKEPKHPQGRGARKRRQKSYR